MSENFQSMNARLQTAEHVLFKILIDRCKAEPRSVRYETDKCSLDVITKIDLRKINPKEFENAVNDVIARNLEVKKYFLLRKEAEKIVDLSLVPKTAEKIRIVDIVGFDQEACAGNHVDNTNEIGKVKMLSVERKGKDTYRFYFSLEGERETTQPKKTQFQTPRGTRDFLPEEMIRLEYVMNVLKKIFEKYGFENFETPTFENFELLAAKGGGGDAIKDQIYYFKDKSDRELGLRFDLTVPLARVVANNPQLPKPFKRYCIGRVWRYEEIRKDRFREFWQCDIDTIGSNSMSSDTEILAVVVEALETLGFKKFCIKLNNRKILTGLIELIKAPEEKRFDVFRAIDKLDKFDENTVKTELENSGLNKDQITQLFKLIKLEGSPEKILKEGEIILNKTKIGLEGLKELKEIVEFSKSYGFTDKIAIDFSLARGLDYYTGPIFEVLDTSGKNIGSLAGGGRYDKLIEIFGGRPTPATGISFGIERIIEIMKEEKMLNLPKTKVKVFVASVNEEVKEEAIKIAKKLRKDDIPCLVDLMNRNLTKQLEYADSLDVPYVVIVGSEELKKKVVKVKDMKSKKEFEVKLEELSEKI